MFEWTIQETIWTDQSESNILNNQSKSRQNEPKSIKNQKHMNRQTFVYIGSQLEQRIRENIENKSTYSVRNFTSYWNCFNDLRTIYAHLVVLLNRCKHLTIGGARIVVTCSDERWTNQKANRRVDCLNRNLNRPLR